jgi:hypothetical protein
MQQWSVRQNSGNEQGSPQPDSPSVGQKQQLHIEAKAMDFWRLNISSAATALKPFNPA